MCVVQSRVGILGLGSGRKLCILDESACLDRSQKRSSVLEEANGLPALRSTVALRPPADFNYSPHHTGNR